MRTNTTLNNAKSVNNLSELVELHAHISASINPATLWSIAHSEGIKLPVKDYHEFLSMIVLSQSRKSTLKEYLDSVYHPILNPLSTGTHAIEHAVHETLSGAYRSSNITIHEVRLNPMKHNSGGQQDLDHIIMAILRGMERALLEFPKMQAGIIFCLDRQFSKSKNEIIAQKAIKYRKRGVIGIDFANYNNETFHFKDYTELTKMCKNAGLGITAHTGETDDTNDIKAALQYLELDRMGHGIRAAYDKSLLKEIADRDIVLEICPISNLVTQAVKDVKEMKFIFDQLKKYNVKFTINTDWPETIEKAHLNEQIDFLKKNNILSEKDIDHCMNIARDATFTKGVGLGAYL